MQVIADEVLVLSLKMFDPSVNNFSGKFADVQQVAPDGETFIKSWFQHRCRHREDGKMQVN